MYVRVAEITSQSSLQFKMLMAFIENEFLPRNIKAGQLSGEIFRTSDNSCFVISRFTSKTEANKIMSIMKTELEEMKGSNKIKMIEGERFMHLGQDILSSSTLTLPYLVTGMFSTQYLTFGDRFHFHFIISKSMPFTQGISTSH